MTQDNSPDAEESTPPDVGGTTESTNPRDIEATAGGGHGGPSDAPDPVNPEVASEAPADEGDKPPAGVGESTNRRGEDVKDDEGKEAGRSEEGVDEETGRPVGSSDMRDGTGV